MTESGTPTPGQDNGRADRHVLTLDLKDDPATIEAYRTYHAEVWPEVASSLRNAGVLQLDIYLLGRRLVMIVELQSSRDLRRVFEEHASSHPRVVEWERLMASFQQPAPGARPGEWWGLMEPICRLSGQSEPDTAALKPIGNP